MRKRQKVVLQMVMAFVIMILLGQLWLFTVALEAMENPDSSPHVVLVTFLCSLAGYAAVGVIIRQFLRAEGKMGS